MNVYEKLKAVQTRIKAPKNLYNSFGKYNYRNAESILEALKPLLSEVNACVTINDDIEPVGDRIFLKSTVNFIDCENGETVSNHAYAEMDSNHKGMSADQITGCCSSYCRKYCLNAMFLLDDTKDADTDEYAVTTSKKKDSTAAQKSPAFGDKERKMLKTLLENEGITMEFFCGLYKIKTLDEVTAVIYTNAIKHIADIKKKMEEQK